MPLQSAIPIPNVGPTTLTLDAKVQLVVTDGVPTIISEEQTTVAFAGQVIVGAAFAIVKTCVQLADLLQASATVYKIL